MVAQRVRPVVAYLLILLASVGASFLVAQKSNEHGADIEDIEEERRISCEADNHDRTVLRDLFHAAYDDSPQAKPYLDRLDREYGDQPC